MFSTWWPLLLVVASSVGYQVGLKEVSDIGDPMVSLTVTYLAASVVSFVIYFFQSLRKESFLRGDGDALHVRGRLGGVWGFRRGEQSHRSGADADRISALQREADSSPAHRGGDFSCGDPLHRDGMRF